MNAMLRAWAAVGPDAPAIAVVSTLQVAASAGLYPEITAPLVLLSLPVTIVLYGRVLARVVPSEPAGARAILEEAASASPHDLLIQRALTQMAP